MPCATFTVVDRRKIEAFLVGSWLKILHFPGCYRKLISLRLQLLYRLKITNLNLLY